MRRTSLQKKKRHLEVEVEDCLGGLKKSPGKPLAVRIGVDVLLGASTIQWRETLCRSIEMSAKVPLLNSDNDGNDNKNNETGDFVLASEALCIDH